MRVGHWVALCQAALGCAACTGGLATDSDGPQSGSGSQELVGPAPDYVIAAVTDPPAAALNGASFSLVVTVQNVGTAAALVSSTTRYYLSLDALVGGDRAFAASSAVGPLAVGGADTRSVTLMIPTAPAGSYHVVACADRSAVIPELDNHNNCTATAGVVAVSGPDLVVEAISEPPALLLPFATFTISETTRNIGTAAAAASTVAYFLSSTPSRQPGSTRLSPTRAADPLAEGAASSGAVTAFVPTLPPGGYFLVACADSGKRVPEADEQNNCTSSTGTLTIPAVDLAITSLAEPPAAILAGSSLALDVTTANVGNLDARSTATRFFLSLDPVVGSDLPVVGSRLVPALAAGTATSLTARISVARTTPSGDYFLIACADAAAAVPELSEGNNCRASIGQVAVTQPATVPAEVTVQLLGRQGWGDPEPGQQVLAYGPDGTVAARVATDAAGTAQVSVPAGGSVTVVELQTRHITTFQDVQTGDVLTVGDLARFEPLGVATVIVPVAPLPQSRYIVEGPCALSGLSESENVEVNLFNGGCGAGPQPLMATLQGPLNQQNLVGYLYDPEVDVVPGGTAAMDGDWLPPITFPVDVAGIPDGSNIGLVFGRFLGPQRVYLWQGTGEGETLTLGGGHLVGSLLQAFGGDGLLMDLTVGLNRILDYRLTDLVSQIDDVSEDLVTVPTDATLRQGELEPGGPQDVVGIEWNMTDGATVDGMVVWIEKASPDLPPFAWTVVMPARPMGANDLTLPRLPADLVPVWAGEQISNWTVSAVDSTASSYAEFHPDAEPQRAWQWRWWQPTIPGKVRIGSSN